jgi:glycosyltransferase involved in cell wall biosynthesis
MRIGLNLLYLLPDLSCGSETYATGLLNHLAQADQEDEFIVFLNREGADWRLPDAANFSRVVCPVSATSRPARYFYEQVRFPRLIQQHKIDLLHSLGYVMPLYLRCRTVVTIFDINYEGTGAYSFPKKQILRFLVAASARRSDHILTISEASKHQIVSRLQVPPEKMTVTLLAPKRREQGSEQQWQSLVARLGIRGRYLLALSSFSPSKNIPLLLRIFARLPAKLRDGLQLVLAGHEPLQGTPLRELTSSLQLGGSVLFTGYLSDVDLRMLMSNALVFVFPSLYEGFGLPVLEAMAAGAPVICSNAASLPEVAGDAAVLFDPRSPDQALDVLEKVLTDPRLRQDLAARGRRNLERFSWTATARSTVEVYRQVASRVPAR